MSTPTVSPLRQRMIEDMNARKLCAGTQRGHIRSTFKTRRLAAPQYSPASCQSTKSLRDSPLKRALSKPVNQDTDHR